MSKIYIRPVRLKKWFPANDSLAATVARMCILREDFALEMNGMYADAIGPLDEHSRNWRRLYFFRNMVRTLMEIRSAIETLQKEPDFKRILSKEPKSERSDFNKLVAKLNQDHPIVKEVRNSIGGGHVSQGSVKTGLMGIDCNEEGFIEVAQTLRKTHFKFAYQLVVATLLGETPADRRQGKLVHFIRTIAGLLPVFEVVEKVVAIYAEDRGLT